MPVTSRIEEVFRLDLEEGDRLWLPKPFYQSVTGDSIVMTRALDALCVECYTGEHWARLVARVEDAGSKVAAGDLVFQQFRRAFFGCAQEVLVSSGGRVAMLEPLKILAGIDREAVAVVNRSGGGSLLLVLWSPEDYEAHVAKGQKGTPVWGEGG